MGVLERYQLAVFSIIAYDLFIRYVLTDAHTTFCMGISVLLFLCFEKFRFFKRKYKAGTSSSEAMVAVSRPKARLATTAGQGVRWVRIGPILCLCYSNWIDKRCAHRV